MTRIPEQVPPESDRNPDQAWFWTPEWLASEREADEQAARGKGERYESTGEFLASLA